MEIEETRVVIILDGGLVSDVKIEGAGYRTTDVVVVDLDADECAEDDDDRVSQWPDTVIGGTQRAWISRWPNSEIMPLSVAESSALEESFGENAS